MRKKRTTRPWARGLRTGASVLVGTLALWLAWLVGDPAAALDNLRELAGSAQVSLALLSSELGLEENPDGLSHWDRLVLAQSSLLGSPLPSAQPEPSSPPPEESRDLLELDPAGEDEEPSASPPSAETPEGIIPRTMVAGSSAKYVTSGNVSVYNHTDYPVDIPALLENAPQLSASGEGPKVLIYHSHATESYSMEGTDVYEPSGDHRTLDTDKNMVRVGEEMKAVFEAAGIGVVHDTTLYDYPSYNDAYNRSVQGVAENLKKYPSIVLVLDVHRDALVANDGTIYKVVAGTVDDCAQVMMVLGSDASGQVHPNWKVNLALALSIQSALSDKWATLARPLVLRPTRFNQHLSTGTILVEVGTHGNTLQEAITAARLYTRTVVELMEREEVKEQVARYKKYADLVRNGDYYRLSDPFRDVCAAWAFVSEKKDHVLLNVVMQEIHGNMPVSYVRLKGLQADVLYEDTESGKQYYGSALMKAGIPVPVEMGEYRAFQTEFRAVG